MNRPPPRSTRTPTLFTYTTLFRSARPQEIAMNLGQLARQAGVPIDTVRYYGRQRRIPEPARSASGYRQYAQDDVTRLNFIRRAKTLGFTLEEIGELMAISGNYSDDMNEMRNASARKLEVVEERLAELRAE